MPDSSVEGEAELAPRSLWDLCRAAPHDPQYDFQVSTFGDQFRQLANKVAGLVTKWRRGSSVAAAGGGLRRNRNLLRYLAL